MPAVLFTCAGGQVSLPHLLLCDREDGGHLVVHPPRDIWERSLLPPAELAAWSLLVAATGRAMLETLPCLRDGCLNYWEAGNWALHPDAPPKGPKHPPTHRRVHHHVLGRSPDAKHAGWRWGEAPRFQPHDQAAAWSAQCAPLTGRECRAIAQVLERLWPAWARVLPEPAP